MRKKSKASRNEDEEPEEENEDVKNIELSASVEEIKIESVYIKEERLEDWELAELEVGTMCRHRREAAFRDYHYHQTPATTSQMPIQTNSQLLVVPLKSQHLPPQESTSVSDMVKYNDEDFFNDGKNSGDDSSDYFISEVEKKTPTEKEKKEPVNKLQDVFNDENDSDSSDYFLADIKKKQEEKPVKRKKKSKQKNSKESPEKTKSRKCNVPAKKKKTEEENVDDDNTTPIKCKICFKKFKRIDGYRKHVPHHPMCEICGQSFKNEKYMLVHKESHTYKKNEQNMYVCPKCPIAYNIQTDLEVHLGTHDQKSEADKVNVCKICDATFPDVAALAKHRKKHKDRRYFCDKCPKSYFAEITLQMHQRAHSNPGDPTKCEFCGKECKNLSKLTDHMTKHTTDRNFQCDLCEKAFKTNGDLTKHRVLHNRENSVVCEKCGKGFVLTKFYTAHLLRCNQESCPSCIDGYSTSEEMQVHHALRHAGKPLEETRCETCNRYFISKLMARHHKTIHDTDVRQFECEVCRKRFKKKQHLENHSKTHSDEREFECNYCLKRFKLAGDLRVHVRSHTGEKPYKCDLCSKAFVRKHLLNQHKFTH